jgi:hypothetical protein
VQFFFVTTWTVYVIYLPQLLAACGLPPAWTPWILVLDQLVFMLADVATGLYADKVQRRLGRLGPLIVGLTAVSCAAFVLLPLVVGKSSAASAAALGLILVWTTTSSALRAPPWVLLGRHAARPALPWLNALTLLGLAAAGAIAPYLGVALKNVDPRLPFALSSLALLACTTGLVHIERRLGRGAVAAAQAPRLPRVMDAQHMAWMAGILLLATGFQTHYSINAAAQFLRHAAPADLEWLMPLFWVGFGAAMWAGAALCKRHGALAVLAVAALCGAASALVAAQAGSLQTLIAAQLVAGGAWACMLMAIYTSAEELGRSGREGLALGTMFAMLALATIARIAVVLAGLPRSPALAPALVWVPVGLWLAGAGVMSVLAWRAARARRPRGGPTVSAQ